DSSTKFQTNKKYAPKIEKKIFTLHLNTADTLDFQELRGIGSGYAKRIFNYRQKLGGFVRKEQLLEVWGIDSALYQSILPFIILDIDQIEKININTIDLQSLKKHPYLDYYQAKEIIKYREKKGGFQSVNELKKVNLMDGNTFEKLHLYLSIK
ncbi:MAG: helix-hairpin-helix domain-containing protein, partial [Bacteroidales bacterium]